MLMLVKSLNLLTNNIFLLFRYGNGIIKKLLRFYIYFT